MRGAPGRMREDRGGCGEDRGGCGEDRGGCGEDRGGCGEDRGGCGEDRGGCGEDRGGCGEDRGGCGRTGEDEGTTGEDAGRTRGDAEGAGEDRGGPGRVRGGSGRMWGGLGRMRGGSERMRTSQFTEVELHSTRPHNAHFKFLLPISQAHNPLARTSCIMLFVYHTNHVARVAENLPEFARVRICGFWAPLHAKDTIFRLTRTVRARTMPISNWYCPYLDHLTLWPDQAAACCSCTIRTTSHV